MIKKTPISKILTLSFSFAKANFKLRNEGSYLGILWYLLSPLMLFLIILFIKNEAFSHNEVPYYPVYLLIGILMYHFFTQTIGASINIISSNSNFIKSIKIPTESLVIARVAQSVFSHIFEIIIILTTLLYFHVPLVGIVIYAPIFLFFCIFVLGISFIFSTLGVYFSDLNNLWVVASQFLFFITPIFYTPIMGSTLYLVNQFNPLYYFITASREMFLYNNLPDLNLSIIIVGMSFATYFIGYFIFIKNKHNFAEYI